MENILNEVDEEYYCDLCRQADALGMESLTEEQQYIIHHWNNENNERK